MSGGSWEYVGYKVQEAAERLVRSQQPERRALGERLALMAQALLDIEWVDSADYSPGREADAIRKALEPFGESSAQIKAQVVVMLRAALERLEAHEP